MIYDTVAIKNSKKSIMALNFWPISHKINAVHQQKTFNKHSTPATVDKLIRNKKVNSLCLSPSTDPTFDGDKIIMAPCAGSKHRFMKVDNDVLIHTPSGLCLGVSLRY